MKKNYFCRAQSKVAQMVERAPHDLKVVGSNPDSGSYEKVFS